MNAPFQMPEAALSGKLPEGASQGKLPDLENGRIAEGVGTTSRQREVLPDATMRRLFLADLKTEILRLKHALVNMEYVGVGVASGSMSIDQARQVLQERGALDWTWCDDA